MKVKDYMTTSVFTVGMDKKMLIVREIMNWANIRHVPVVDADHRLVGMISHRDVLRASLSGLQLECEADQRHHLGSIEIDDVMCKNVQTIDAEAPIQAAARLMRSGQYGCLPVVDNKNRLLGIITEHDLLELVETLEFAPTGTEE